jgi:hypothetical protein
MILMVVLFDEIAHRQNYGGYNGKREASFEAQGSEDSPAGFWGRRRSVYGDGGQRISNCADSECTVARHRTASRNYAR